MTQDEDVVRRAPLFTALDEAAAVSLRASMDSVKIAKGGVLFAEGDEGDHLYVIVEGKLKLGTSSGDGRENLLSILGPGEMFGELSLFDPGPRTSTATAVTDAKLLSLGHIAFSICDTGSPCLLLWTSCGLFLRNFHFSSHSFFSR